MFIEDEGGLISGGEVQQIGGRLNVIIVDSFVLSHEYDEDYNKEPTLTGYKERTGGNAVVVISRIKKAR